MEDIIKKIDDELSEQIIFQYTNKHGHLIGVYRLITYYDDISSVCKNYVTNKIVFKSNDFLNQEVNQVKYVVNSVDITKDVVVSKDNKELILPWLENLLYHTEIEAKYLYAKIYAGYKGYDINDSAFLNNNAYNHHISHIKSQSVYQIDILATFSGKIYVKAENEHEAIKSVEKRLRNKDIKLDLDDCSNIDIKAKTYSVRSKKHDRQER